MWNLIFQLGSTFLNIFITDYMKRQELISNFQAWITEMQARSNLSVDARDSYNKQLDELNKENADGSTNKVSTKDIPPK